MKTSIYQARPFVWSFRFLKVYGPIKLDLDVILLMTCCTRSKMLLASIQRVSDFLIPRAPSLKFEKVPSFHCCSRRFERNFLPSGRDLISSHEASSCQASQSNGALNFPNFWNHFLKRCNPDMGTKWPEMIPPYPSY